MLNFLSKNATAIQNVTNIVTALSIGFGIYVYVETNYRDTKKFKIGYTFDLVNDYSELRNNELYVYINYYKRKGMDLDTVPSSDIDTFFQAMNEYRTTEDLILFDVFDRNRRFFDLVSICLEGQFCNEKIVGEEICRDFVNFYDFGGPILKWYEDEFAISYTNPEGLNGLCGG